MENVSNLVVGVDVSKSTLDIYLHTVGEKLSVKNNVQGIKKLTKILSKYKESVVVCEASGGYENLLAKELYKDGYKIRIENPRKIRSLAYAKGVRAKTDSIDAKMIAEFGATISQDHEKQAMTLEQLELKELVKYKNNLKEAITQGKARLQNPTYCRTQKYIKKDIDYFNKAKQRNCRITQKNRWSKRKEGVDGNNAWSWGRNVCCFDCRGPGTWKYEW